MPSNQEYRKPDVAAPLRRQLAAAFAAEAEVTGAAATADAVPDDRKEPSAGQGGDGNGDDGGGGGVDRDNADPDASTGGSPPADDENLQPASAKTRTVSRLVVAAFGGGASLAALLAVISAGQEDDRQWLVVGRWWAIAFGFGCVTVGLGVLHVIGKDLNYGIFLSIVGKDRRYSTSLAQIGLWTIAIVTSVGFLLGRAMFEGKDFAVLIPDDRWNQYLLLLGGPFAAAVLAKGVVTYKLSAGTLQKSEPTSTTGGQIVKNDAGDTDLVDAQYLLFNVIALGYFLIQMVRTSQLPEIPPTLLALTGATAATYVANKAAQKNAPTISAVTPPTAQVGDQIIIYGTNFDPGDKTDDKRRITLQLSGYTSDIYAFDSTDTRARFIVPPGVEAGDQTVMVTSTAGSQTDPHNIHIRAKVAVVTETVAPRGLRPGATATLKGENLGLSNDRVSVKIGTMMVAGTPKNKGTELDFRVPNPLPDPAASTVELTISVPGQADLVRMFPVDQPTIRSAWREDDSVSFTADGLSAEGLLPNPQVLVNDWAASTNVVRGHEYKLTLPQNIEIDDELKLTVSDDLGRKSAAYTLAART